MESLVKIFAALILVFSLSGVASAKDEKGAMTVKPEMQLSLVCENDEVKLTLMSLESGIIEKAISKTQSDTNNHDVSLTVISEEMGVVMKKTGKDALHENISFKDLRAGKYKIVVNFRNQVVSQEIIVK